MPTRMHLKRLAQPNNPKQEPQFPSNQNCHYWWSTSFIPSTHTSSIYKYASPYRVSTIKILCIWSLGIQNRI